MFPHPFHIPFGCPLLFPGFYPSDSFRRLPLPWVSLGDVVGVFRRTSRHRNPFLRTSFVPWLRGRDVNVYRLSRRMNCVGAFPFHSVTGTGTFSRRVLGLLNKVSTSLIPWFCSSSTGSSGSTSHRPLLLLDQSDSSLRSECELRYENDTISFIFRSLPCFFYN